MSAEATVISAAAVAGVGPIPPAPVAAAVPVAGPPPVAAPAAPAAPVGVTLTPEQWAAYTSTQSRLAELESAEQKRAAEARETEIKALQAKGQIEQAFALQRQQAETQLETERKKLRDIEDRAKRYALDGELGRALSGHQLVTGGAEHLTKLLRDEFQVEAQGDSFVVRSKDFRPVGEFIGSMLGRPEYSCFVRAQNPGGGTAGGTTVQSPHTAAANPAAAVQPRNLGDAIALQMAGIAKQHAANATSSGGSVLAEDGSITRERAAGFGLRPLSRQA
jgi:hypothetical protein